MTEIVKMNLQVEMLNVFNHPNFTYGSGSPANSASIVASPAITGTTSAAGSTVQRNFQFRVGLVL